MKSQKCQKRDWMQIMQISTTSQFKCHCTTCFFWLSSSLPGMIWLQNRRISNVKNEREVLTVPLSNTFYSIHHMAWNWRWQLFEGIGYSQTAGAALTWHWSLSLAFPLPSIMCANSLIADVMLQVGSEEKDEDSWVNIGYILIVFIISQFNTFFGRAASELFSLSTCSKQKSS